MKYLLLIHQGTTPVPGTDAWEALSEEEKGRVYADYQALTATPGVTPGHQLEPPETATTVLDPDGGRSPRTARSSSSRRRSAAGSCSTPTTSTPPSSWPRAS